MGFTFKCTYAEAIRIRKGDKRMSSTFLLYGATAFNRQYLDKDRRDFPYPLSGVFGRVLRDPPMGMISLTG
jgi:hypothetical protein